VAACFVSNAAAQQEPPHLAEGYITAVDAPLGFDLNGSHVTTTPATVYGLMGKKDATSTDAPHNAVKVGAYVEVLGTRNKAARTLIANSVLFRDEADRKLDGFGVIDMVIAAGPEPVFRADGYRIRIVSTTATTFSGGLKALGDVRANTWVKYQARRDRTGELVATKAAFIPGRTGKVRPASKQTGVPSRDSLIDAEGNLVALHTKVRYSQAGGECGWHKVPGDLALQERVLRVGLSVVPAYQKLLADDDPAKIQFRFYAVDEARIRTDLSCWQGLVLVPRLVVERLANDDQLAAVLADGVALNIQVQSTRLIAENRELVGGELAVEVAGWLVPGVGLAGDIGALVIAHEMEARLQEQRGRIALALMANAGYDPWQAPEAWRLLAPKQASGDPDSLKFPSRSGYQLGILNLQYGAAPSH